jgi:hypothetical protein
MTLTHQGYPPAPDRRIQIERRCGHGVAGIAGSGSATGPGQERAGGSVDGTVDSASTQQ